MGGWAPNACPGGGMPMLIMVDMALRKLKGFIASAGGNDGSGGSGGNCCC